MKTPSRSYFAAAPALMCLAVIACPALSHAGTVSASFKVTASFVSSNTGTCVLNPATGSLQCSTGGGGTIPVPPGPTTEPSQPPATASPGYWQWQPNLTGYRGFEGFWLTNESAVLGSAYSGMLGAQSYLRFVTFGGLDYLEMTVSW